MKTTLLIHGLRNTRPVALLLPSAMKALAKMKKMLCLCVLMIGFGIAARSQSTVVVNEGFESSCSDYLNPFQLGCISNWFATSGTPDTKSTLLGPAYQGSRFVHMYSNWEGGCVHPELSEGIALSYPFQAGVTYKITYAAKGAPGVNPASQTYSGNWILTNGLVPQTGGYNGNCHPDEYTPDIPAGSQVLPNTVFNVNSWTSNQYFFTPNANFSQIWFRNHTTSTVQNSSVHAVMCIDDVKIEQICTPTLAITGASSFCLGAPISFTGSSTNCTVTNNVWTVVECNSAGVAVNGAPEWWSSWQSGVPGALSLPSVANGGPALVCGKYYRIKLAVQTPNISWVETTKIIYIDCPPAGPAVLGINGDTNTSTLQVLICKPIMLQNFSGTNSAWYRIEVYTRGLSQVFVIYNSGNVPGPFSSVDLHSLLHLVPGNYDIGIYFGNDCGVESASRSIEVIAAPVASLGISGSYQTRANTTAPVVTTNFGPVTTAPDPIVPANPLTVGRSGTIFNTSSSTGGGTTGTAICGLEVHLDQAVGGAWVNDVIPAVPYTNPCASWNTPPPIPIASLSDIYGDPFFTAANAPAGSIWRIRMGITNECSTLWRALPFQIGVKPTATTPGYVRGTIPGISAKENNIHFTPVPFSSQLSARLQMTKEAKVSIHIFSVDGRLLASPLQDQLLPAGSQNLDIDAGIWPAGLYFYDCSIDGEHFKGKLIKE